MNKQIPGGLTFDSEEQRRAWEQTIEFAFNYVKRLRVDAYGIHMARLDAEKGNPIAEAIVAHHTMLRMQGTEKGTEP